MTAHFPTRTQEQNAQRKARKESYKFLREYHETLTALLKLLGHHDLAAQVTALSDLAARDRVKLPAINGTLSEARRCLVEAPFDLEGQHDNEWSDLDAALRWMGARLTDFDTRMRSLRASSR